MLFFLRHDVQLELQSIHVLSCLNAHKSLEINASWTCVQLKTSAGGAIISRL